MRADELAKWLSDYPTATIKIVSFDMKDGIVFQARWNARTNEIWLLAS